MRTTVKPRIFVVDDERTIAWTLSLILRQQGYDANPFYTPNDLLQASEQLPPTLVISDVMMPHMTGIELAVVLQQAYPTCKVLLFSGQACTLDLLHAAREKGHTFEVLSKPVLPAELLKRVKDITGSATEGPLR